MRRFFVLSLILSFLFCGSIFGAEGDVIWTRTYNGAANGADMGIGIAVDGSGNVYVTGYEDVTGQSYNIWVRKYDSNGNEVWTKTYNGAANGWDIGIGIAVDGSGNVYINGYEDVTGQSYNIWVRKYDSNGNEVWTKTYNGAANGPDVGCRIAVDGSGNVYVTGYEYVPGQLYNIWVRKYDSGGNEVWTKTYNGAANGDDFGNGIAVDGSGNVYVNGYEWVTGQSANIWVRKYDSNGNEVWTRTYNGAANGADMGFDIAVDGSGNVYVTGCEDVTGQSSNIWVRKYKVPPPPVLEVSTLSFGFGEVVKPASRTMVFTISNSGGGTLSGTITTDRAWIGVRPTSFDSNDVTVFVTVYTDTLEVWRTYTGTVTIDSNGGKKTLDISVLPTCVKSYPNPYRLSSGKPLTFWGTGVPYATIKIYTLSGELVKTLKETKGEDKITWDGRNEDGERIVRGIYFFTTKNPKERNTGKFTVVR